VGGMEVSSRNGIWNGTWTALPWGGGTYPNHPAPVDAAVGPRSKLGLQLGPRKQPFGFVWVSYKRTHRRTTAGPRGHPRLEGLALGKDPVGRTTLRPPMDAGDGQMPVNLVQKRRCQLKSRG
jgi:hypothetical protein